ncbi:hypothetical protein AVEN_139218-1 [Araneus ventricosus]|uniref:Uncharacterized protein n=1 Tax=Araneus ventricosus TaxID=182803 RepID=A0A4Y2G002_ARAVE|nr:hypothetical protein AVEN_139218-1 [Araneus ventricosus]
MAFVREQSEDDPRAFVWIDTNKHRRFDRLILLSYFLARQRTAIVSNVDPSSSTVSLFYQKRPMFIEIGIPFSFFSFWWPSNEIETIVLKKTESSCLDLASFTGSESYIHSECFVSTVIRVHPYSPVS